jgi:hypothetical protein
MTMNFLKVCLPCIALGALFTLIVLFMPFKSLSLRVLDKLPFINTIIYKNQKSGIAAKIAQVQSKLIDYKSNPNLKYINADNSKEFPSDFKRHYIASTKELYAALEAINSKKSAGNVILFENGTYDIPTTLVIKSPNTFMVSLSGNAKNVILQGSGMEESYSVNNIITVHSPGFLLDGLTLKNVSHHLIQIKGELGANFPIIRNCIMQDAYQQLIKVTAGSNNQPSLSGLVENCTFEYTDGIGPNFYIGGIDAHGVRGWTIRNNIFKNIASPDQHIAEYAVHLWSNAQGNIVDSNIIIDSDRGIGFGMGNTKGKDFSNYGGVISKNIIYHSDNDHPFADTGIAIENSPKTLIENNLIYLENNYNRAIEYRFVGTAQATIKNNRTNRKITSRNGGTAQLDNNDDNLSKIDFFFEMNKLHDKIAQSQQ